MQFFNLHHLNKSFPPQTLIHEFLALVAKVSSAKAEEFCAQLDKANVLSYGQFLSTADEVGAEVSPQLKNLLSSEVVTPKDKFIYNYFSAKDFDVEVDSTVTEFHSHTYDIQITFSEDEVYVFSLDLDDKADLYQGEYNKDTDTQFLEEDMDSLEVLSLHNDEGVIIPPGYTHMSGYAFPEVNFEDYALVNSESGESISLFDLPKRDGKTKIYKLVIKVNPELFIKLYQG